MMKNWVGFAISRLASEFCLTEQKSWKDNPTSYTAETVTNLMAHEAGAYQGFW